MTIDLVYPASVSGSENYSSEPPLGPIALYSSLPDRFRSKLRFLDSTVMKQEEIERTIVERRPEVVALSCTTFNYCNAVRVAELAKRHNAIVIVGGIHITHLRDRILAKMQQGERQFDYVVAGYGEPAFGPLLAALADDRPIDTIPNLSYLKEGQIVVNTALNSRFGTDPLPAPLDYSKVDCTLYSRHFVPFGNLSSVRIPASTFTQRGCAYSGSGKCTFCSIETMNPRRSGELFEQDIVSLVTDHNVDHIRITDGDFTLDARHMSRMADAAQRAFEKTGKRPVFHCFARADEIDEYRIAILKRLNVVSLFIGYESGSNEMLRAMQKHTTSDQNLQATALLKKHGIDVICAGLVLGAEGETEATLQETMDFVRALKEIGNTYSLVATPLIPLPGSPSFTGLTQRLASKDPVKAKEMALADDFDIQELVRLWNIHHCHVSLDRIINICEEIEALFRIGIRLVKFPHPNGKQEEPVATTKDAR